MFYLIAFGGFYVFFLARAVVLSIRQGRSIKSDSLKLNLAVAAAGLAAAALVAGKLWPPLAPYLLSLGNFPALEYAGMALIVLGLLASAAASLGLGASWRIGVPAEERTGLVTGGIYGLSRNPYFLSYDIALLGSILAGQSLVVALLSAATAILFHLLILDEERHLAKLHGEAYAAYRARVRRYL